MLATFMVFAGVAFSPQDDAADQKYTIQVGTSPEFAPYEYMVSDNYEGIDMDMWKAIAKALACDVNFNTMDFDSIINAVIGGKFDVGASGFTITEERKQSVNFTTPYSEAHQVVLMLKSSPLATVTSWEQLVGHTVAVESGTTGEFLAEGMFDDVRPYNTYTDVISGITAKHEEFAVLDDLVAISFAESNSELIVLDIPLKGNETEEYAFLMKKGNVQLLQYTNRAMEYLEGMGVVDEIFAYYASIGYSPDKPGYFTTYPEKLEEIDVVVKYYPVEKHTIEIASSPDFPPYDYLVSDGFEGIDMDIWRAIGHALDCDVNFNVMEFDSIINAIQGSRYDVGASGFTITDERKESVNFTNQYAVAYQNVLILKDGPNSGVTSYEQLMGQKISVETATTGEFLAEEIYGAENVIPLNQYADVVQMVLDGKAGFAIIDDLVAVSFVESQPDKLEILEIEIPGAEREDYAFIMNKSNTELLGYTNKAMSYLEEAGIIDDIYDYYASIKYNPSEPGYFTANPEKLNEIEVLVHYMPGQMKETVKVATSPDFAPYDYLVSSEFEGIDMDIWRALAQTLDFEVEFNTMDFSSIINAIQSKQFNAGASGFTITDERKESVNFSEEYAIATQKILILKDSPYAGAETIEDLLGCSKIGVEDGTTGQFLAEEVFGLEKLISYMAYPDVLEAVNSKKVDFAILDDLVAISFAESNPDKLTLLDVEIPGAEDEHYAFVFNKSDTVLLSYINKGMVYLKETGVIDDIFDYYATTKYSAESEGYFSAHPEALSAIQVIDHYSASSGDDPGEGKNWLEVLWDEIIKNFVDKDRYKLIIQGLQNTVYITLLGLALGLLIGILGAIVRSFHDLRGNFKILNAIVKVYITVIRGTPLLVQLLIIYFIVFASSGLNSIVIAGIAFGINSGAYVAEIVRAGINAVPEGQLEASESLGMTFNMAMFAVILPQAIRNILPALCNEGISLLKETSIAGYIGIIDVTKAAMLIRAQTYSAFVPLIGVALIYLVIVLILQYLVGRLERRLNNAYR